MRKGGFLTLNGLRIEIRDQRSGIGDQGSGSRDMKDGIIT
jgi:hypothetical protein